MPFGFLSRNNPLRIEPFYGFRNHERLYLTARALRADETRFADRGFVGNVATMLGLYASQEVEGVEVRLTITDSAGKPTVATATSNAEGFVRFEIPFNDTLSLPMRTGWERGELQWDFEGGGEATAFILAPGRDAGLGVISDIDDTIMETGITGNVRAVARHWKRVVAQMPSSREAVPGAPDFYSALGGAAGPENSADTLIPQPRPRPVFYVSSSPWNLFSYLVQFKRHSQMPMGPILLRDWGFNTKTLGSEGHGSHKVDAIARIVNLYPELRFALVGDSSQKDLPAFSAIAVKDPARIAAVFIRKVDDAELSPELAAAAQAVRDAGVPLWFGRNFTQARDFLEEAGLAMDAKVEGLVSTVSEGQPDGNPLDSPRKASL